MQVTNGDGPERTILYARVSTDEQARSGYSLRQQIERLREWAKSEGYEVLEEVSDPGQSGASLERPGMDRVRDLVRAGGVSMVLAQDRDRFAREPAYIYLLRPEFAEQGCSLRALNDRGDDSPEGELTDGILDQLAKFDRAKIAERTRRGKLRKAREGKLLKNGRAQYGFRYDDTGERYVVNEDEMRVVRRIFRNPAAGASEPDVRVRQQMFGEGAEHFGAYRAEIEVRGADEAYVTVASLTLAEKAGERKKLEAALPIGVSLVVQPPRQRPIQIGVDQTLK